MPVKVKFLKFIKKTIRWLWPSFIVIAASCIHKSVFISLSFEQIANGLLLYAVYLICIIPVGNYLSKLKWFEDESKTALLLLFITYFFFEYSIIFSTWEKYAGDFIERYVFNKQHTVFILLSTLVGMSFILLLKRLDDNKKNRSILIFVTIVLTVIPFIDVLLIPDYKFESDLFNIKADTSKISQEDIPKKIFWIILDEHPSSLVLDEVWGYKDTTFRKGLESLGFTVYDSCISNYNFTPFSIAATTHGTILPINRPKSINYREWRVLAKMINYSPVFSFLKSQGYELHNLSFFNCGYGSSFKTFMPEEIIGASIIGMILTKFKTQVLLPEVNFNKKIIDSLKTLLGLDSNYNNKSFVYAHLFMPHSPYLPLDTITTRQNNPLLSPANERAFLGHIEYTDSVILDMLKTELNSLSSEMKLQTLIILQSDHGYRFVHDGSKDLKFKSTFGILNALYWKGDKKVKYYNAMSSVNTFRILFRDLWGINLSTLKDSSENVNPYFKTD